MATPRPVFLNRAEGGDLDLDDEARVTAGAVAMAPGVAGTLITIRGYETELEAAVSRIETGG